jgi:hypothetical protein
MNDLLFASLEFKKNLDKQKAVSNLLNIEEKNWFWDPYRSISMLSLMTKNPVPGPEGTSNLSDGDFQWLEYTPKEIIDWFEEEIFPWMGSKTRLVALLTRAGAENSEHIDCGPKEIGTMQHKFRLVLQGKTDTLYFKTEAGDLYAPNVNCPFLMDGGWPHGMKNIGSEVKITLAAGAPWTGKNEYNNATLLLKKSDYQFPKNYRDFFNKNKKGP